MDGRGEGPWYIRGPQPRGVSNLPFSVSEQVSRSPNSLCFPHRLYSSCWPTTSGERWPQSPEPLPPSPRSWFPPSKRDRGELESGQSTGSGWWTGSSREGRTGGREDLPLNKPLRFGEARRVEKASSCRELRALSLKLLGWRPLPRFSRPPSCRGQRRPSLSPAPLLPSPARGYRRGGGITAGRSAFTSRLSPRSWRAPPVGFLNKLGKKILRFGAKKTQKTKTYTRKEAGPVAFRGRGPSGGGFFRACVCFPLPAHE